MKLNILYIRPLKEIIEALTCDSIIITYINKTSYFEQKELENNIGKIKYIRANLENNFLISNLSLLWVLCSKLKNEKIDVILVNAIRDLPAILLYKIKFCRSRRPLIFVFSHSPFTFKNKFKSKISLFLIRKHSDGFIALSKAQARYLKLNGIDNICVIPNTTSISLLSGGENELYYEELKGDDLIKIVYVAHIEKRKSQHVAIEAIKILKKEYKVKNVCLKLIGGVLDIKYKKHLVEYIMKNGLTENIVFTGKLNHETVLNIVKESDIVIFTSTLEVLPRAIIEAMALGRPIIATEIDGVVDLIKNYETGILIHPNDCFQLAKEIYNLIMDKKLRREISIKANEYVKEYCSHEKIRSLLYKFYIETYRKKENTYDHK
jgi:glycosyltransferase involved in cell wall biosynthesis